jgi:hypothetical protein
MNPDSPHKGICKDWTKLKTVWPMDNTAIGSYSLENGMTDLNNILRGKAVVAGYGENEIGRLFLHTANFSLQIHRYIGSDPLEG